MLLRSITVAAMTTLVTAQSVQIHPKTVDDLLPASTYAAVRFGGLEACRQATGQLPMTPIVKSLLSAVPPEMRREILDGRIEMAADHVRNALQQHGVKPSDVRAMLGQPMTWAFGRLSIEGMGPSMCLVVEEGNNRESINRCVRAGLNVIRRFAEDTSVKRIEIAGTPFYHVSIEGYPVFAGSIAGNYCISNSRGYLKEVIQVAAGKKKSLVAATAVAGLRQQLPAPPLAAYTINASSVMDMLTPHLPYEAADFSDALGLGRLDLIYGAVTASEKGGADMLHIGIGGSEKGLAKSLVAAPADLTFAKACSKNTVVFGAGSFDIPAVIDAFQRFIKLLPAEAQKEMRREMGREMAREFRQMGTSPAEVHSLLKAFGNQVGFAFSLERGAMPKPEMLVHVAVNNAETVSALMQRIEAISAREGGLEWRTRKAGDQEVRFCNVPIEDKMQLSPCYALSKDALWIGTDVAGLIRSIKRGQSERESLADAEDFQTLAKETAGASGVLHVRSFRGVQIGWRTVETMGYPMIDAQSEELGFDSSILPDSDELAEALGTTTVVYRVDDDGVTVNTKGPMTFGAILAAFGALGDEVLSRATGKVF